MVYHRRFSVPLLLILAAILMASCAVSPVTPQGTYYVTPVVSYLRQCPQYDCEVAATLYQADALEFLDRKDNDWWQMHSDRTGQTGWIQSNLLSRTPVSVQTFYVVPEKLPLRECPTPDCPVSEILQQGDRVQKIVDHGHGWWRILVEKDKTIGWIPVDQVTENPVSAKVSVPPPASLLFVAPATLSLHVLPLASSPTVKVLNRNEKVEKLSESGAKWLKVRHPDSGAEGWTLARFLKEALVSAEPPIIRKKKRVKKEPAKKKPHKEGPPEFPKPEVM
jgi:uncharacterized protein YgiM (DUF1202 family)